jgi:hypothetical protein
MADNFTGSCLCNAVKYIINGPIKAAANCHCNSCKKTTGSVFATVAIIDENNLEIIEGQDALTTYQVSEKAMKHFCSTCGTPIFNLHKKYPGHCMVAVGSLDEPSLVAPAINIFCESMMPWVKSIADLQCFEKEPTR